MSYGERNFIPPAYGAQDTTPVLVPHPLIPSIRQHIQDIQHGLVELKDLRQHKQAEVHQLDKEIAALYDQLRNTFDMPQAANMIHPGR